MSADGLPPEPGGAAEGAAGRSEAAGRNRKTRMLIFIYGMLGAVSIAGGILAADLLIDDPEVLLPDGQGSYPVSLGDAPDPADPGAVLVPVVVDAPDPLFEAATVLYPVTYDDDGVPSYTGPVLEAGVLDGGAADLEGSNDGDGSGGAVDSSPPGSSSTTSAGGAGAGSSQPPPSVSSSTTSAGGPGGGPSEPPPPGSTGSTQTGGSGGGSSQAPPTDAGPPPAAGAGGATATIIRFLDLCAENPSAIACPGGLGATVLLAGSGSQPPPLQIEALPEATSALFPGLRCDPGWPSQTAIPLALLSNRPFSLFHVELRTADGATVIDEQVNLRSPPSENALYDQRVAEGKPLGATLGSGFHTCLTLSLDRGPGTFDRNGPFLLSIQGFAGTDALGKTVPFTGSYRALRPPVRILPLDGNRAYLIVPQLPADTSHVWVYEDSEGWQSNANGPRGCEGTPPQLDPRSTRRSPLAAPTAFSGLDSADYPWDRSYSHYTLWDLNLAAGAGYTLCVAWADEGKTEEWKLETPDGVSLTVLSGALRHTRTRVAGTLLAHIYGVPGCFVANPHFWPGDGRLFPDVTVYGDGTYHGLGSAYMCRSWGSALGDTIELRALFPDGSNEVYGIVQRPTSLLASECGPDGNRGEAPCTATLEWRNQRVLCGGGLWTDPNCAGDLWYSLGVAFSVEPLTSNHRPDPQDWGISQIARLGESGDTLQFP